MNHYYDAYDKRYQIIHKKGHSWSGDIPTPIVLNTLQKYSVSKDSFILETGCGEGRDAFPLLENGYDVLANYSGFLTKHFWKEHTFWSDGYFVCSIGEANPDTIRKYIESQG